MYGTSSDTPPVLFSSYKAGQVDELFFVIAGEHKYIVELNNRVL